MSHEHTAGERTRERTYIEAVRDAHAEVMREDEDVFVMGEDVQTSLFESTVGLAEEFGTDRVRDTPISEQAFTGMGIGAAMAGKQPIVEYEINTLPHVAMEQLVDQAQRIRFLSGGERSVPITFTLPSASVSGGHGGQHSDNPYPALAHYGMKVATPATPYEVKGVPQRRRRGRPGRGLVPGLSPRDDGRGTRGALRDTTRRGDG